MSLITPRKGYKSVPWLFGKEIEIPEEWEIRSLGEIISTLGDYHSNGSYEKLRNNVTLLTEENFAIYVRTTNFEQKEFSENFIYVDENAYNFL